MDEACSGKSRDATNNAGNPARTWYTGDKTIARKAEHAPCATTETRTAEYSASAFAKSTAAEADACAEASADAAFHAACETDTGNEAGAALESVYSACAE